jgi:hypothetical protein
MTGHVAGERSTLPPAIETTDVGRNKGRNRFDLRSPVVSPCVLSELGFNKPNWLYEPKIELDKTPS